VSVVGGRDITAASRIDPALFTNASCSGLLFLRCDDVALRGVECIQNSALWPLCSSILGLEVVPSFSQDG
jgi:hypothetical protein